MRVAWNRSRHLNENFYLRIKKTFEYSILEVEVEEIEAGWWVLFSLILLCPNRASCSPSFDAQRVNERSSQLCIHHATALFDSPVRIKAESYSANADAATHGKYSTVILGETFPHTLSWAHTHNFKSDNLYLALSLSRDFWRLQSHLWAQLYFETWKEEILQDASSSKIWAGKASISHPSQHKSTFQLPFIMKYLKENPMPNSLRSLNETST